LQLFLLLQCWSLCMSMDKNIIPCINMFCYFFSSNLKKYCFVLKCHVVIWEQLWRKPSILRNELQCGGQGGYFSWYFMTELAMLALDLIFRSNYIVCWFLFRNFFLTVVSYYLMSMVFHFIKSYNDLWSGVVILVGSLLYRVVRGRHSELAANRTVQCSALSWIATKR